MEFVANTNQNKRFLNGLIYKQNRSLVDKFIEKVKVMKVEKVEDLFDIEYKLERITGSSLDYYEIEEIP